MIMIIEDVTELYYAFHMHHSALNANCIELWSSRIRSVIPQVPACSRGGGTYVLHHERMQAIVNFSAMVVCNAHDTQTYDRSTSRLSDEP